MPLLSPDVRFQAAGSTGRRNTGIKSLCWGFKLQGLTWPFVELTRDFVQIGLRVYRQVAALRKVLSQQTVGVLIRAVLPRALQTAKVYPARIRQASAPAFRNCRKRLRRCFCPVARIAAEESVENKGVLQCSWHSVCFAIDARVRSVLAWTCRNNDARHGLRERPPKSNFQTRGVA